MHQECRAPVDVGAQQAQAFVGGVPRLDHDEVQFVAQEVFDDALIARFDFEEIGEHSGGSVSSLQRARLKKPPHRFGGVTVLGDDRFERSFFAECSGVFGTDGVEMFLVSLSAERFVSMVSRRLAISAVRPLARCETLSNSRAIWPRCPPKVSDCDEAVAISVRRRCSSRPMPASRSSDCVS